MLAVPSLTAALLMLLADHHLGTVFFNPAHGGSIANYLNTFWFFGHPEVYMLIMGAWEVVSEIVPVFSRKPLYGYRFVILALMLIMALSFTVWGHHMYTTGLVNDSFFSVTTELISVPTGVLVLCWLFTLWKGKLSFEPPMLFALGFIAMFVIGGIDGVWMASPRRTSPSTTRTSWSRISTTCCSAGACSGSSPRCTTGSQDERPDAQPEARPMAVLAPADLVQRDVLPHALPGPVGHAAPGGDLSLSSGWGLTNMIETISAYVIALSMLIGLVNIIITLRKPRNAPADPWGGNTLEWATSSPPPPHNFDALPEIHSERPVRDLRLAISAAARSAGPPGSGRTGTEPRPEAGR